MDNFRTIIAAPKFGFEIDHSSKVVMIGSCFSDNIGTRLKELKINVHQNPFGILFNPFSIFNSLERMLNNRPYTEEDILQSGDHFVSLDHHGVFNGNTIEKTLIGINKSLDEGRKALLDSSTIFITLGSAWVYEYVSTGHIVANCHKIPNKEFKKRLLTYQDVHLILRHIPQFLASKKINANVVFTVSPVRHWKDGPSENQRSKSLLNAAIHAVVDEFEDCHYFPSYEFMMDDLRDYRFYAADMLHPNTIGVDYIWDKFQDSFFSEVTKSICKEVKTVMEAVGHKPMDPESNSFQRFLKRQLELIDDIESKHKGIQLKEERAHFVGYVLD